MTAASKAALLTAGQVAERLACHRNMVYRLVEQHGLPHVHLGRSLRFDAEEIERWIARNMHGGAGHEGTG